MGYGPNNSFQRGDWGRRPERPGLQEPRNAPVSGSTSRRTRRILSASIKRTLKMAGYLHIETLR